MSNRYYVSAYATSPSFHEWDAEIEKKYFSQLADKPEIAGIEHPFLINSKKYSLIWLLDNVPAHWNLIVTALPSLMQADKLNSFFGIASAKETGRRKAVSLIEHMNLYVQELNQAFGRKIVRAVHLHSSPKNCDGSLKGNKPALIKSLIEICQMDWGSIELNIEHCDAYMPGQAPDKGFLTLEDEIGAIENVGKYGIVLNWGRSTIETRSSNGALNHLHTAINKRTLKGFVFSGCTDQIGSAYGCWKDTHMPPKNFIGGRYLDDQSLLGLKEIKDVVTLLGSYDRDIYYGIKVLDPDPNKDLNKKIGLNIETIEAIETAYRK